MSRTKRFTLIAIASLIAVAAAAEPALAQRGGRGRVVRVLPSRPVLVAPYYSPFFSPFFSPFYDPFYWDAYRWGHPGWYGPAYGRHADESSARIQVTPRHTEVYVDGYLAGVVDDFDGFAQRLKVSPGEHVIELYLDGHKTIAQTIRFEPGESYRIRHAMEPVAAGEAAPARPTPKASAPSPSQPAGRFDAFGRPDPVWRTRGAASDTSATLAIRVQPGDATILVDGERWQGSGDRLEIQVTPGEHRIEVQRDGYQPFTTTVRVRPGDTSPINVSLTKSGDEQ